MAYGQSGHFAISFQDSYGTVHTDSPFFIPLISEGVGEKIEQLVENNMYGRLAESPTHEGAHEIGGEIRTEAHPVYLGAFLKAALGQASSALQTSAYRHEFLPAASDWDDFAALPPLTMEIHRDAGSAFLYYDLLASSLVLDIAHGQLLSAALTVLGGRFTRQAPSAPAFKPGRPWSWDVVSASYGGGGIADFRRLTVGFDNQLATFYTLTGGKAPHRVKREGPQKVTVEGTFLLQDQALFQEYLDQSERPLVVSFQGEAISAGENALLTLEVPRLRFAELAPQLTGAGALEVSFTGAGVFDAGSGYALRATLTNTQPAY
jgi:hypothetical protein